MRDAHLSSALAPAGAAAPDFGALLPPASPRAVAPLPQPVFREIAPAAPSLRALQGIVLLGGSVWMSGFRAAIGRPVLDLPITSDRTLLQIWCERIAGLNESLGRHLPLRVVVSHGAPMPVSALPPAPSMPRVIVERDASAYRGTGGVLRDMAVNEDRVLADDSAGDPDACLFVANAAQLPLEPLFPLVRQLAQCDTDLSFVAHYDGTPSRLMLIRAQCLRVLPRVGFVDLMEQGLPIIAREHRVTALHRANPISLPVRTMEGYIQALQRYHRGAGDPPKGSGEDWRCSFALVEEAADVHPSACVHDAVVLRGGRVERDAVVARSVVCPGGVVRRGEVVVDQLICPGR